MELPHHILDLIEKYVAGNITKEELNTLNKWYHQWDDSQATVETPEQAKTGTEDTPYTQDTQSEARLSQDIYNRLMHETALQPALQQQRRKIPMWKKYAAAITLLILISATGYFYLSPSRNTKDQVKIAVKQKNQATDLPPGSPKAQLTLSNGTIILLDSAQNGTIAQQGAVNIQKRAGGAITYQQTSDNNVSMSSFTNSIVVYNEMITPRGGTYQLTLADGTRVWLNAATDLRFPTSFPGPTREVSLKGEAYFEVAKNQQQPFLVHTDKQTVQVLGTHFNVNAYPDEPVYRTTLLEGKVKVTSNQSASTEKILSPGQQATLSPSGRLSINPHPDLEQVTGWKDGKFVFRSTDFKTILRQISRWYDVDIVYEGKSNPVFTGQLSKHLPVSKVFGLLSLTNEINYQIAGHKIIVSRK